MKFYYKLIVTRFKELDARVLKITRIGLKEIARILQGRNASSDCSQVHS
jgi:hypothetical protein